MRHHGQDTPRYTLHYHAPQGEDGGDRVDSSTTTTLFTPVPHFSLDLCDPEHNTLSFRTLPICLPRALISFVHGILSLLNSTYTSYRLTVGSASRHKSLQGVYTS